MKYFPCQTVENNYFHELLRKQVRYYTTELRIGNHIDYQMLSTPHPHSEKKLQQKKKHKMFST